MFEKLLLLSILYALPLKAITLSETLDLCTAKTNLDFQQRIETLDSVKEIDQTYNYPIAGLDLIKIRALDMIKSQTYNKNDKLYWLLEFRPMPDHTQLPIEFYPRVILNCNKSDRSLSCKPAPDLQDKLKIFTNFEFNLSFVPSSPTSHCSKTQNRLVVVYKLSINDQEFEDLKQEAYKEMTGNSNSILTKFMDSLFDPEKLFKSYIMNLYSHW